MVVSSMEGVGGLVDDTLGFTLGMGFVVAE